MPSDTVLYEVKNRKAYITLNRPEAMNALNRELSERMREVLWEFQTDPDPLVAIMTGAGGRAFSAGMDLKERARLDSEADGRPAPPGPPAPEVWKPIIAAIDGYCVAGGLERALQCDIRIATAKSEFGLPEPRWSLTAGYGLHNLSRMIPLGGALYIQLTGSRINAEEALRYGLIHKVLPDREALMAEADRIADDILLCAPLAVQAIKRIVMQGRNLPVEYSHKLAEPITDVVASSEDRPEGPRAFAEKRRPVWKGR